MDVHPGHCWCCETLLPQAPVHCGHCTLAAYCSMSCRGRDTARHGSVECQMYGPKECSACGNIGDWKECAECNSVWYCNRECQQHDWASHKQSCKEQNELAKLAASNLSKKHSVTPTIGGDFPYYIGNTPATDLLQLDNNEWLNKQEQRDDELARDYHILSAGCGNLRHTVLTASSLPDRYRGNLHITLNDLDPYVMARNVLLLFMLARFADTDGIASNLTTIWYSLHITKEHYNLITTSLDELLTMSIESLRDATRGLVNILDDNLESLRRVWRGWRALECQRHKRTSIDLRQQRKAFFEIEKIKVDKHLSSYLSILSTTDQTAMREWYDYALFFPTETKETNLPFDNPTLTGRQRRSAATTDTFVYCVNYNVFPFTDWDCIKVRQSTTASHPSPMVMYHTYVTNRLQETRSLILQGRLHLSISLANCIDFPRHHQTLKMPGYDRIFTSNLADYIGVPRLLQTFKPLLNTGNSCSVIVTEFLNWFNFMPNADVDSLVGTPELDKLCLRVLCSDPQQLIPIGLQNVREYYNNTACFLHYLRADIMAGGIGISPLKCLPEFSHVKKYHGMQMRDFREGLNKLVPFMYRVNARNLTLSAGWERAVEWCLPNSDT